MEQPEIIINTAMSRKITGSFYTLQPSEEIKL